LIDCPSVGGLRLFEMFRWAEVGVREKWQPIRAYPGTFLFVTPLNCGRCVMNRQWSLTMNESTDTSTKPRSSGRRTPDIKERMKQDGREKIESGKRAAADQIAEIADAIDMAGAQLDQSQPTLANYASRLAEGVGGLASRLREDSMEDLYRDMRQVASRHPGMFLLGSAAVGLVLARFIKASGDDLGVADDEAASGSNFYEHDQDDAEPMSTAAYRQGDDASPRDPSGSYIPGV
jgi:hypothetical protein